MKLAPRFMEKVARGKKKSTIRSGGRADYRRGWAAFVAGDTQQKVYVWRLSIARLEKLNARHAEAEGYETSHQLKAALMGFYPDLLPESLMTIVDFELEAPADAQGVARGKV